MVEKRTKNKGVALVFVAMAMGMVGLTFASVPLYNLFCRVTGYGGTTQQADTGSDRVLDRDVEVRFDGSVNASMPWKFRPEQKSVHLKVGEQAIAFYKAVNTGPERVTGTATFNVTPQKAGQYFVKIDCFCFTEQTLEPGQDADMPVTFYVDPYIDEDPDMDDVKTITLSYTFFRKEDPDSVSEVEDDERGQSDETQVN
ncbi:cytochrome c oxidase assembly protein [Aestuariispira ectoiniformans]|uniref:cytochrome c oxidase assembly protein n=1 Tax=Aestuariispira ectoiniformans TaxID=2775080 RepID=UPI00223BFBA6|nr:cytochrome c oxidase assembly protein [Aestuariispira ectoiniformans]